MKKRLLTLIFSISTSLLMSLSKIYKWQSKQKILLDDSFDKQYTRVIPWKITKYSCVRIYRNKKWWKTNLPTIKECWNEVLHYRKVGYDELLNKNPSKRKNTEKLKKSFAEYSFLSDSE